MSIHNQCGKPVYWFKKKDGSNHRPLDYAGAGLWIKDGVVQDYHMPIYKIHVCDSKDVEAYQDEQTKQRLQHEEYERALREAQIEGLTKPCSKCGAKINEACVNLNERKKGNIVKTRWPHPERIKSGN